MIEGLGETAVVSDLFWFEVVLNKSPGGRSGGCRVQRCGPLAVTHFLRTPGPFLTILDRVFKQFLKSDSVHLSCLLSMWHESFPIFSLSLSFLSSFYTYIFYFIIFLSSPASEVSRKLREGGLGNQNQPGVE